jgi:hypothetical protein
LVFSFFFALPGSSCFSFPKKKKNQLPVKPLITAVCGDSVNLSNVDAIPSSFAFTSDAIISEWFASLFES